MKAFTVFMPVHNTDAYLNEAIESVLKQDYTRDVASISVS